VKDVCYIDYSRYCLLWTLSDYPKPVKGNQKGGILVMFRWAKSQNGYIDTNENTAILKIYQTG
jgi:hypothetical protein